MKNIGCLVTNPRKTPEQLAEEYVAQEWEGVDDVSELEISGCLANSKTDYLAGYAKGCADGAFDVCKLFEEFASQSEGENK